MENTTSFVTVTHKGDIEAFRLLRKSIQLFAPNLVHYIIVDDEQFDFYNEMFGQEAMVRIVSSKEVLPVRWEEYRKLCRKMRGGWLEKVASRLGFSPSPYSGWCLQQLLKIHFLASEASDVVVFLDSDLLLTAPFKASSLFEEELLLLPEARARSVEDYGFEVSSRVMLGEHRNNSLDGYSYIHQPPRFYSRTGRALIEAMTNANSPIDWEYRFIRQQWPSEYHLLGYAARSLERYAGYRVKNVNDKIDTYEIRFSDDVTALEDVFTECLTEHGKRGFLLVQSNLQIHSGMLCARLNRLLDDLAASRGKRSVNS